jgi:hypothetical protein
MSRVKFLSWTREVRDSVFSSTRDLRAYIKPQFALLIDTLYTRTPHLRLVLVGRGLRRCANRTLVYLSPPAYPSYKEGILPTTAINPNIISRTFLISRLNLLTFESVSRQAADISGGRYSCVPPREHFPAHRWGSFELHLFSAPSHGSKLEPASSRP